MLDTVLVIILAWLLLAVCGWLVLAPLRRESRDLLLPAAPLFGAGLIVVVLHDTTLLLSVRAGLPVVGLVLVALAVVAFRRDREWWRPSGAAVGALLMIGLVTLLPAAAALAPSAAVGDSSVVQPSDNNDAFYYVSVADWLQLHPATDEPSIPTSPARDADPPSFGPAKTSLSHGIRIGQELVQASISTVLGSDNVDTWYPLTALWLLLIPAAAAAATILMRLGPAVGATAGLLAATSSLTLFQLASQNSDALLGIPMALVAVGAIVDSLEEDPLLPRVVTGMVLTAWIGTYTELMPLVAPALVVVVLVRPRRHRPQAVRHAAIVVGWALLLAPLVWIRSVSSLILVGGMSNEGLPSAFMGVPPSLVLSRLLGLTSLGGTHVSWLLPLFLVVGLIGLLGSMTLSRLRWMWIPLFLMGLVIAVYTSVRHRPYTQQRLMQLWLPFVVLIVVLGCVLVGLLIRRRWRDRRAAPSLLGLGLVLVLVFAGVNLHTASTMHMASVARSRHVDNSFEQAAGWLRQVGGPEGRDALVVSNDFFTQLWITDALRDEPEVAYSFLYTSYQYRASYWNGAPRRWVLVDAATPVSDAKRVVVRENSRFRLLDLSRGAAVVVSQGGQVGSASFIVIRSPSAPQRSFLLGSTRHRVSTDSLLGAAGHRLTPAELRPHATRLAVDFSAGQYVRRLVLRNDVRTFDLSGVRLGSTRRR